MKPALCLSLSVPFPRPLAAYLSYATCVTVLAKGDYLRRSTRAASSGNQLKLFPREALVLSGTVPLVAFSVRPLDSPADDRQLWVGSGRSRIRRSTANSGHSTRLPESLTVWHGDQHSRAHSVD